MSVFVLVHGAWHGGWCWDRVRPLLESEGHRVFTPTLTGLAERAHLLTRDVNLSTHIRDVVDLIVDEDLHDVVLVGHSYAGQVISGVVRHVRDRLRHVAYLDANFPLDGETGLEAGLAYDLKTWADQGGDGWRIPVPKPVKGSLMGVAEPSDVQWLLTRLTDHPLATFEEQVSLDPDDPFPIPGSYIRCTTRGMRRAGPERNAERVQRMGWPVMEIETGHDVMITEPERTAEFLLQAAS